MSKCLIIIIGDRENETSKMLPLLNVYIYLELEARDDDECVGGGVDVHPLVVAEDLEARHGALVEQGYEVRVRMLRHS